MSNSPDQLQKRAIKRLMQDYEEIQNSPVENVSAAPLESDMFEWHCNLNLDDTAYHLILFFPQNYPYESPSAEFVPPGFVFTGGATMPGKKGVKVCLSIFSDFAQFHTEWASEKGMGWSPGYTVQTVLLNMVSFLAEVKGNNNSWVDETWKKNAKLAQGFKCKDCGHTAKKPFPELPKLDSKPNSKSSHKATTSTSDDSHTIVDYISKTAFTPSAKPKDKYDLFGYGLVVSGPTSRPSLTTPCEFLTGESFYSMQKSVKVVHSMLKEELKVFLPMFLNKTHGGEIKDEFCNALDELKKILPNCKTASLSQMVLKSIPNLMSATVVEFSKGSQHTSDNHLNGYFALHRLFLWIIDITPGLQEMIDGRLQEFIDDETRRTKKACPHIGEWLMLLSASSKYRWTDAADAYLSESWRRNVMWYVKDDAKLGYLDTDKKYRLANTYKATLVSRKLLAFQVLFLDIAMPNGMSRESIISRYDKTMGFPSPAMVQQMKDAVTKIDAVKTYEDWFKVLKLSPPSEDEIYKRLVSSVEYSINTDGYKWTFFKNQGGWGAVLKKYPNGTPGWKSADSKENAGKGKKLAKKGKGTAENTDEPAVKKAKGVAQAKPEANPKGRGRGKKKANQYEEPMEIEEKAGKSAKGRGRKRQNEVEESLDDEMVPKAKNAKKQTSKSTPANGKGRGKRGR